MRSPDSSVGRNTLRPVHSTAKLLRAMVRQAQQLHLTQTAGSLSFLSLLALVPMFSIVFAVTTALPTFARLRQALQQFMAANLFPSAISDTIFTYLNQFAAKASGLSLIGSAAFFITAFTALLTIEETLNRIWVADRPRPLANRLTLYWTLLTLAPLMLGASLTVHGVVATAWLRGENLDQLRNLWLVVLPWVISLTGLTLLYRLLPSAPVRWREALAGALLAALLLHLLRSGLGWYVAKLPSYTVVYGAFAALPLLLLWLFLGWMALLVGALLAANLRFWGQPGEPHRLRTPAERFHDARQLLGMMAEQIGANPDGALPVARFRERLGDDPQRFAEAALLLARLGYVTRLVNLGEAAPSGREAVSGVVSDASLPPWNERWIWAQAPAGLTLRPLFEAIWHDRRGSSPGDFPAAFLDQPLAAEAVAKSVTAASV
ncbi:MAG: YihY family inner membrane protein [Burkholderiales bacterium]|nr:YihY family inner membrane protein [Burkholderiales bacterium]